VQLAIDSLDRLVELVEEAGGRLRVSDAARQLFALPRIPDGVARSLLGPLVDGDARLAWRGAYVSLAGAPDPHLFEACFVVFDLETTGLAVASARICEIGAVRLRRLELAGVFETLVAPGVPLPRQVGRLTGLSDDELRRAPRVAQALAGLVGFAGDAVLVAHNARFDVGFANRELERLTGKRLAATVIDTVPLARNLLHGRVERTSLASLAHFFGTSVQPCHRALADAQATAEVFLRLVEIAQERGTSTVSELEEQAAPRPRRVHCKRYLVRDAPSSPGVYLFRDRAGCVLYVGKARDLKSRLRTYFQSSRQRPTVEAALDRLDRVEWRPTGSELAAALAEVALIRELRPPANTRTPQPERYVYLHRRAERVVVSRLPSRYGPLRRRALAQGAARALKGCTSEEFDSLLEGGPLERLRDRLAGLTEPEQEFEARELRRRIGALDRVVVELNRLERLKRLRLRILAPSLTPGACESYLVWGGRVHPPGADPPPRSPQEIPPTVEADHLDWLLVVDTFLRFPTPELTILPLAGRDYRQAA
jgi:DNA polymerase III epsilon subunit family exonuclease